MPLLKHQLILHPDIVSQFELDKPVTPYERKGVRYISRAFPVPHSRFLSSQILLVRLAIQEGIADSLMRNQPREGCYAASAAA